MLGQRHLYRLERTPDIFIAHQSSPDSWPLSKPYSIPKRNDAHARPKMRPAHSDYRMDLTILHINPKDTDGDGAGEEDITEPGPAFPSSCLCIVVGASVSSPGHTTEFWLEKGAAWLVMDGTWRCGASGGQLHALVEWKGL